MWIKVKGRLPLIKKRSYEKTMGKEAKLFEKTGIAVAAIAFFVSLLYFYLTSRVLQESFLGALISSLLFWMTYIGLRVVFLAFR